MQKLRDQINAERPYDVAYDDSELLNFVCKEKAYSIENRAKRAAQPIRLDEASCFFAACCIAKKCTDAYLQQNEQNCDIKCSSSIAPTSSDAENKPRRKLEDVSEIRDKTAEEDILKILDRETQDLVSVLKSSDDTEAFVDASNPSTLMLEIIMSSFAKAPALKDCERIVVCDGYRIGKKTIHRRGILTSHDAANYDAYIRRLDVMARARMEPFGPRTKVLALPDRRGFGYAVKASLDFVRTPFVMIVQHDRLFYGNRPLNVPDILRAMQNNPALKYVQFPTVISARYLSELRTKRFTGKNKWMREIHEDILKHSIPLRNVRIPRSDSATASKDAVVGAPAQTFVPLFHWYDSTHIARTDHYRHFVFGRSSWGRVRVTFGSFPEDKLGQELRNATKTHGLRGHREYGTFVFEDREETPVVVRHLDGRSFKNMEQRREIENKCGRLPDISPLTRVGLTRIRGGFYCIRGRVRRE
eukprot:g478.t1